MIRNIIIFQKTRAIDKNYFPIVENFRYFDNDKQKNWTISNNPLESFFLGRKKDPHLFTFFTLK